MSARPSENRRVRTVLGAELAGGQCTDHEGQYERDCGDEEAAPRSKQHRTEGHVGLPVENEQAVMQMGEQGHAKEWA
jgi:hypothetical protein